MYKRKEIESLVLKYPAESGANKKNIIGEILETENSELFIYEMIFGQNSRASLRLLCDMCKKQKCRDIIKPLVVRDADKLIKFSDDKARKNACMLIGICAPDECADILFKALNSEKIRFVKPSIILALGNTSAPAKYLRGYVIEPGEEKHVREEAEALKKALLRSKAQPKNAAFKLPEFCTVTYISHNALKKELGDGNFASRKSVYLPEALDIKSAYADKLRCWKDALFYIGTVDDFKEASNMLDSFGCRGFDYRIEAGHLKPEERNDIISLVSKGLTACGYNDNPSSYSFEVFVKGKKMFAVFPDKRFDYRKESIPASINPVAAASIMRLCSGYFKNNASVLDPFCGSGTMLIERAFIKETGKLVGVDISPYAIKAACANRKASGLDIALIKGDILDYSAGKYDEIVSNMPFGLRVSGHKSNIRLYKDFSDKLGSLLKEDGKAFLFTQEKTLLRDVIGAGGKFKIVKEENIETGGLCPALFILERIAVI